ncbi:helix-turn-helix domain-containing protein [Desulfovibrio psychrotolerans]|uniref:Helix-turn-helix domain-containing protein n=1 Tax=Desulfovibrio psychrotolerans TaxID=415242 RepID=A0A7J0BY77_9BACT|nr:hypothetical protein DSM19430T_33340 [Desulfovibrio psychrotolerans]
MVSNSIAKGSEPRAEAILVRWLTEKEVAAITRLSLSTLRAHRFAGRGIPYAKIGRSVRYSATEVQRYMTERQIVPHKVVSC